MKSIKAFFRLIRWRNLLIVVATQWFIWSCVLLPLYIGSYAPVFLDAARFLLLSGSTVLVAAAGYIINDYFDVKIDLINRPEKVIIEKQISRRMAIFWHSLFNAAGFLLGLALARSLHDYYLIFIQLGTTILLWFYATSFKRQFVTGNLVVALLTALTILMIPLYEPSLRKYALSEPFIFLHEKKLVNPLAVIAVYGYFAFMLTWMREVVKDMEDFKGDAEDNCVTMPIKIGLLASSRVVIGLGIFTIIPLMMAAVRLLSGKWCWMSVYISIALIVPLTLVITKLPKKATVKHYAAISKQLKLIMLAGILSLLLYNFLQYIF
ncbi:MAG: geranylgeranylglycerol-phosphate geranylgeranyltransferase [Edaphocola sp.]